MPAPRPIVFQREPVALLATLAAAVGSAQRSQRLRREGEEFFLRRKQQDLDFLSQEFDRRATFERGEQERFQRLVEAQEQAEQEHVAQRVAEQQAAATQRVQVRELARQQARQNRGTELQRAATTLRQRRAVGTAFPERPPDATVTGPEGTLTLDPAGGIVRRGQPTFRTAEVPASQIGSPDLVGVPIRVRDGRFFRTDVPPGEAEFARRGPGGFVGPGRRPPAVTPQTRALEEARDQIDPAMFGPLKILTDAGLLTGNQLIEQIEDARPQPELTRTDLERRRASVRRLEEDFVALDEVNDPDGRIREALGTLIIQRRREIDRATTEDFNPNRGRTIMTERRPPAPGGRQLTTRDIDRFLQQAGGDVELARRLARDEGFATP